MAAPAPTQRELDAFDLLRAFATWRLPVLLVAGLAAGFGARHLLSPQHAASLRLAWVAAECPQTTYATTYDFGLPAAMLEGHGRFDASAPRGLRDYFLDCRAIEQTPLARVDCVLRGPEEARARALAERAREELQTTGSPLWVAMAEARFVGHCGFEPFDALEKADRDAPPVGGSRAQVDNEALRQVRAEFGALDEASAVVSLPPRQRGIAAPLLGLLAGLLGSGLLAVRRAPKTTGNFALTPFTPPRYADLAAGGLLLSAGMDRVLVYELGGFTLRFGQLCALLLVTIMLVSRWRARAGFRLPARAVTAALLFLLVATFSGFWSANPTRTVGYLAWGTFDVAVVLLGLVAWIDGEERLQKALKLWLSGMLLGCGMAAVQLVAFKLTGRAPLGWMSLEGFPRVNGFSYEPSYFALYLVPGAALLLMRFAMLGRAAWRSGLLGALLVLTVGISTSRSGWISVSFVLVLIAWRSWMRVGRAALKRAAIAAGGFGLAFALLLLAWPRLASNVVELATMAFDRREISSTKPRLESLQQAATLVARHPALGVGHGGYGAYMVEHPEFPQRQGVTASEIVTTNLYLELASETGLLGLIAALLMLGSLLAPLLRSLSARRVLAEPESLAHREGLVIAAAATFGVQYQFCQTLWRLDIWVLLSLCFAAGLIARRVGATQASATPEHFTDAGPDSAGHSPAGQAGAARTRESA